MAIFRFAVRKECKMWTTSKAECWPNFWNGRGSREKMKRLVMTIVAATTPCISLKQVPKPKFFATFPFDPKILIYYNRRGKNVSTNDFQQYQIQPRESPMFEKNEIRMSGRLWKVASKFTTKKLSVKIRIIGSPEKWLWVSQPQKNSGLNTWNLESTTFRKNGSPIFAQFKAQELRIMKIAS